MVSVSPSSPNHTRHSKHKPGAHHSAGVCCAPSPPGDKHTPAENATGQHDSTGGCGGCPGATGVRAWASRGGCSGERLGITLCGLHRGVVVGAALRAYGEEVGGLRRASGGCAWCGQLGRPRREDGGAHGGTCAGGWGGGLGAAPRGRAAPAGEPEAKGLGWCGGRGRSGRCGSKGEFGGTSSARHRHRPHPQHGPSGPSHTPVASTVPHLRGHPAPPRLTSRRAGGAPSG